MNILVLNAGSSSLKYSLIDLRQQCSLLNGLIERIGEAEAQHRYQLDGATQQAALDIADHQQALQIVFDLLQHQSHPLHAIGHRVVHGGEQFSAPSLIDAAVIEQIRATIPLAPLHNPANLLGIEAAIRQMPDLPQVAVFDTAFHQTLPDYAYRYALPQALYKQAAVRRYGFHGTSHSYVAQQAAKLLNKPLPQCRLITLHLGNGASVCAIENGRSIDTSMGMTPLEGLIMGSRSGDLDPAIVLYLARQQGLSIDEIDQLLNKQSGLKGICGENDMRSVRQMAYNGDSEAQLALHMYAYRLVKYIGGYWAVLGGADALVFTGGIGENDSSLRAEVCEKLHALGLTIDVQTNLNPQRPHAAIHHANSAAALLVIQTDEELEIAKQTHTCL
jgi:acetate kinase